MGQGVTANTNTYVFGSGKLEAGDDVGSLACLGSLRGAVFTESFDSVEIETDNAGKPIKKIKNQKATLKAGLLEVDLSKFYALRGGLDLYDTNPGTLVEDATQIAASGAWGYNVVIPIENQNHDGSEIAVASVAGSVNTTLVEGTDWFMAKAPDGRWGVMVIDSETVTTLSQSMTITYDYTPAASRTLTSGGKYIIDDQVIRLTHTTEEGKILRLTLYKAHVGGGLELTFPSDESDDVMEVPFEMIGELDVSRSAGDQLYEIYDTRAYS